MAGVMNPGMVTTVRDATMDNPQPSPKGGHTPTDAVQRLDVGGFESDTLSGLRYSPP